MNKLETKLSGIRSDFQNEIQETRESISPLNDEVETEINEIKHRLEALENGNPPATTEARASTRMKPPTYDGKTS